MKAGLVRKAVVVSLVLATLVASGCSFSTSLVVINFSDKPVEVRYRFRDYPGDFSPPRPSIKTAAELDDDVQWRDLAADQYAVDTHSQTVRVTLAPRTALLMARITNRGVAKETKDPDFPIIEIVMRGTNGTVMLQGEQVQFSFAEETKSTYSIAYR